MPVEAQRLVRKMRGGAQAWLIQAATGDFYVVKFLENAQHRRILVNEWLASCFLDHLGLCAAQAKLIRCTASWLEQAAQEGLGIQVGAQTVAVTPGMHFGSRVPVDPSTVAIYDYLPDQLLLGVENLRHYHGMLAFDQWVANADTRQSIYFRARLREFLPHDDFSANKRGMLAMMIDHGYAFQGPEWRMADMPRQGSYPRPVVYSGIDGWDAFEPWLTRITHFPESVIDVAWKGVPSRWLGDGDESTMESLLEQLLRRAKRLPSLLEDCKRTRPEIFPNWKLRLGMRA